MPFSIKSGDDAYRLLQLLGHMEMTGDIRISWTFSKHHATFTDGNKVFRFIKQNYPKLYEQYLR